MDKNAPDTQTSWDNSTNQFGRFDFSAKVEEHANCTPDQNKIASEKNANDANVRTHLPNIIFHECWWWSRQLPPTLYVCITITYISLMYKWIISTTKLRTKTIFFRFLLFRIAGCQFICPYFRVPLLVQRPFQFFHKSKNASIYFSACLFIYQFLFGCVSVLFAYFRFHLNWFAAKS